MIILTYTLSALASFVVTSCNQSVLDNKDVDLTSEIKDVAPAKENGERAALFADPNLLPLSFINTYGRPQRIPQLPHQLLTPLQTGVDHSLASVGNSRPRCKTRSTFCLYDDNYPRDEISKIVNDFYDDVRHAYFSLNRIPLNDLLHHDNTTHKFREGGHFVCESRVQYIRPGWAMNMKHEWMAIVNTETFPQTVRIEECKQAQRRCNYLPPCYKSTCIQRFSHVKLLAINPRRSSKKPEIDIFEIPVACSCFVENFAKY